MLLLLVLALAGLTRKTPIDALSVIFVVDNSSSVGQEGKRQASTFIDEALKHKRKDDMAGVVVFGDQAVVDVSPTTDLSAHEITSAVSPHHTDIAAGLRLGAAIMPPDRARRVVVLSDGAQTRGNVENQVLLSANSELDVASVVIGGERGPDALLEDLSVPARLDQGLPIGCALCAIGPTRYGPDSLLPERTLLGRPSRYLIGRQRHHCGSIANGRKRRLVPVPRRGGNGR